MPKNLPVSGFNDLFQLKLLYTLGKSLVTGSRLHSLSLWPTLDLIDAWNALERCKELLTAREGNTFTVGRQHAAKSQRSCVEFGREASRKLVVLCWTVFCDNCWWSLSSVQVEAINVVGSVPTVHVVRAEDGRSSGFEHVCRYSNRMWINGRDVDCDLLHVVSGGSIGIYTASAVCSADDHAFLVRRAHGTSDSIDAVSARSLSTAARDRSTRCSSTTDLDQSGLRALASKSTHRKRPPEHAFTAHFNMAFASSDRIPQTRPHLTHR